MPQSESEPEVTPAMEQAVGVTVEDLAGIFSLESIKFFGPGKFKDLYAEGITPRAAIARPDIMPLTGARGRDLIAAAGKLTKEALTLAQQRARRQIAGATRAEAQVLTYAHPAYPRSVLPSAPCTVIGGTVRGLALTPRYSSAPIPPGRRFEPPTD